MGAVYAWWNARGLRLQIELKASHPAAGSPVDDMPEQVLRVGPYPAPIFERDALQVELCLETAGATRGPASISGLLGGDTRTYGVGVIPRAGWRQAIHYSSASRGRLAAESWEITATDSAGFFRTRRRCADSEVALVLPRFASLAERQPVRELEASVAAPRAGTGSELFGIREYRSGDSLRRIHWRSSARHGELVVREYEPPGVRTLGIVLEADPATQATADQICRIAASEAWDCIRDGGRVVLWSPNLEPTLPIRDIWPVLEWLALYPDVPAGASGHVPSKGDEVVLVTSRADPRLLDVSAARAWVVGEDEIDVGIPTRHVGTAWPL